MHVALVHDHLAQDGGAEKVLATLQGMYSHAPTYTLVYNQKHANRCFLDKDIRTSFLQKMPAGVRKYRWYLGLMPYATESYDLDPYDVIISSTSAFAKGVITRPHAMHVCYCHTPTRFLWSDSATYLRDLDVNWFMKKVIPFWLTRLRQWDQLAAQRVDVFVANSYTVQKRIKKYYNQESEVIYPPVETRKFSISTKEKKYYLIGGRMVPYKRFDLAILAFNHLGLPLKVFGNGPAYNDLKKMADGNIEFLGLVDEKQKKELFENCIAFLNPQEEDFGITGVEAMSCGRPVIAYRAGGATETVKDGVTGVFFSDQSWKSLADAVRISEKIPWNSIVIREHALQFDEQKFEDRMKKCIEEHWKLKDKKVYDVLSFSH